MMYINALHLINLCIENKLLNLVDGKVAIYINVGGKVEKENWYLISREELAQRLMNDEKGINFLIAKLEEIDVTFTQQC